MGLSFFDQYSILHLAVGIVAYFWSISFITLIILHIIFEYVENTRTGMDFINRYFKCWWPGGKTHPDSLINKISDILFCGLGWMISYKLDQFYK
jgi:hypothetical protein